MAKVLPETTLSAQSGPHSIRLLMRWFNCLLFVSCVGLTGCTSTVTTSNQVQIREDLATEDVRTTGNTAPLELQLTCASAAPANLGLSTDNVLPISSSELRPGLYKVELTAKGGLKAQCTIDGNGQIQSIERL